MKNIIITTLCLAFSCQVFSQNLNANQLFRKFKKQAEVTTISIPGFVAKFGALFIDKEDAEIKHLTKKIKGLKIAVVESNENDSRFLNKKWTINQLDSKLYEPLITVQDGKQQVHFLIREKEEVVKELVMFIKDEEESVMLLIEGKFTIKQTKKLINSIELNDLGSLKKS